MSQSTSTSSLPMTFSLGSIPRHLWDFLTKPVTAVQGPDRRRMRLLDAFLVIYAPFTTLLLLGLSTRVSSFRFTPLIIGGVIAIWAAYILSRSRFFKASMILAVLSINANAWTSILAGSQVGVAALYDALISILLASILLSIQFTGILIVVNVAAMLVIPTLAPGIGDLSGLLLFTIILSVLLIASVWQRNLIEQDRRTELLMANSTLEQRIEARTAELKRAKDEAEKANQVKSAFLASMSHELRTPLNAIINLTRFVADGDMGEVSQEQQTTLSQVIKSSRHLLNLINDVLDMSKIEAGALNLFIESEIDLKPILASVESTGKALLGDKPVTFSVTADENLPGIRADRQRILQILLNIVSNACKFTSSGSIDVRAQRVDSDVLFSIRDTGPGIPVADQAMVFEAFKQTETGLRQVGGTGLGMPISKNLAEAHYGRLWLESEVGKGTTFFVRLPIQSLKLIPMSQMKDQR